MPKLPILKPRQLVKKLQKLGFIKDHQTGSHLIMYHPDSGRRAVAPIHLKDIPKGTLAAILRESQIDLKEFLKN
jgi:predicted RNA binding protein YcfA (HicA-like mRNA interferase family)